MEALDLATDTVSTTSSSNLSEPSQSLALRPMVAVESMGEAA